MKAIWKFTVPVGGPITHEMPEGAAVVHVESQHGEPQVWALVDTDAPVRQYVFVTVGTGHTIPLFNGNLRYAGSYALLGGDFMGHIFTDADKVV